MLRIGKFAVALLAVFVAGLVQSGLYVTSVEAAELKKVSVRLAFGFNAHRSPYLLGVEKGFYREEGLDVEVLPGKGVTYALQLIANKENTFAIVDPPSLMLGVAAGMPLMQVVQLYQKSPNTLISWKSSNIKAPIDLVGKTIASLQGDTTTTMLYALLARNGIDKSAVKVFASGGAARNQTFLSKRAQAVTGFSNDSYLAFLDKTGGDVVQFQYSEFGIDTMGDGVAAHTDTINSDPALVKAFVRATIRSYKYALEHPDESIDALIKVSPDRSRDVAITKLAATQGLVYTDISKKHGVGYSDKAAWQAAEDLMTEFGGLSKRAADVGDYYTNEFLP